MDNPRSKISLTKRSIQEYLERQRLKWSDPATGQELFRPQTGRCPKRRESTPQNIGEFLYSSAKRKSLVTPELRSVAFSYTSKKSEEILQTLKRKKFSELFYLLAPGGRTVSGNNMRLSCVPHSLLKLLSPLIEELVRSQETLTLDDFCLTMDKYLDSLTPSDRSSLLGTKKPQETLKKTHPQPAPRSVSAGGIYARGVQFKRRSQVKLEAQQRLRAASVMKECTFRPRTTPFVPRSSSVDEFSYSDGPC